MFKKILRIFTVGLASLSLMVTGCTQANQKGEVSAKKEELVLALGQEPEGGFDPTTGWGRYGSPLFQSTLFKRDTDLQIINDLAVAYEVSSDGLVWTVELRTDTNFSDGQPLTAEDVKYTYERAAESGSVVDLSVMKKVEVVDSHTVKFTLNQPQSTFLNILANTGIVPKHAHGKDYLEKPIGSGPFKLVQWDKGQQLIVEANPEYYGTKPYFKKITFVFLPEDAAFAAAQAGNVDMAAIPSSLGKQEVAGMDKVALESVDNRGIMFPVQKSGSKTKEGLPIGNDVTADLAIRKAINIAVDRQTLVNGVLEGFGTPAYTICDKLPWWNPETVIRDNDLKQAEQMLSQAGWVDSDRDGVLQKGNLKAEFTLLYPSSDQIRQSLAISVADMLKPLGIKVKAEGKSWDDIQSLMHSNAVLFGWGSHDPLEINNVYRGKNAGVEWFNPGYYINPKVDAYMEQALAAADEATANECWKKAQWDGQTGFAAQGDAPWAWLVNLKHIYLVPEGLDIGKQKVQPHGHGWPITDNIVEWRWKN